MKKLLIIAALLAAAGYLSLRHIENELDELFLFV